MEYDIIPFEEIKLMFPPNGRNVFYIGENRISWQMYDIKSMVKSQLDINDLLLTKKLSPEDITQLKLVLRALTNDMKANYTSTCSVCNHQINYLEHCPDNEHITIKESWGYGSLYDGSTHTLVLCCNCYKDHIMKGSLGKFVQRKDYF